MFISIVLAIICISLVLECCKEYLNHTKFKGFNYTRGVPLLGNLINFMTSDNFKVYKYFHSLTDNFDGKLCYTWIGPELLFVTEDPDTFEIILNSENFVTKPYIFDFMRNHSGMFSAVTAEIWRPYRRTLTPTLGLKTINSFNSVFNEKAKRMVDRMERDIGTSVDLYRIIFKYAADVAFKTVCDVDFPMQNTRGDFVMDIICSFMKGVEERIESIFKRYDFIYQITNQCDYDNVIFSHIHRVVESVIEMKKAHLADKLMDGIDEVAIAKEKGNMNLIQKCLQLEQDGKINRINVREQVETILVAGMDTTGFTVSTAILLLAMYPEYQERVVEELRSLFHDVNDPVENEHLNLMTFTELVLKETMRLFPVGPIIPRKCANDFAIQGGIMPKGTQVLLDVYKSHNNPKYWGKNAHQFFPERFSTENSVTFHPYQFIPFSGGIRGCVGKRYAYVSMKIALAYLLRRYKFTTDLKMHEIDLNMTITLKIANENPIRIDRREW